MSFQSFTLPGCGLGALLLAVLAGCGREEIKVYRVPKEQPEQPLASTERQPAMPAGHPEVNATKPKLSWTLPAGWKEAGAGRMSLASFTITGANDKQAEVAITPLRGLADKEVPIVNMWRQTAGLPELSADEAMKQLQPIEVGGEPGKMFEVTGKADGTNPPLKIVTAVVHRSDTSWFFKLAGNVEIVDEQKPVFINFLKSIKISEASADETVSATRPVETTPPATKAAATGAGWKIPADWKSVAPGPMQDAKFSVPEKNGAKADVSVSIFQGSTGGTLANVNRWRGQLGLPPAGESELSKLASLLDDKLPGSVLVDMNGTDKAGQTVRLIGAIVPRSGQWIFYKLIGHPDAVTPQKEAFVTFARAEPATK